MDSHNESRDAENSQTFLPRTFGLEVKVTFEAIMTRAYKFLDILLFAVLENKIPGEKYEVLIGYLMIPLLVSNANINSATQNLEISSEFPLFFATWPMTQTQTIHLKVSPRMVFYLSSTCMNFRHFLGETEVVIDRSGVKDEKEEDPFDYEEMETRQGIKRNRPSTGVLFEAPFARIVFAQEKD